MTIRRNSIQRTADQALTNVNAVVLFDDPLPPVCLLRNIVFHLEAVNAAVSTLDFTLMGGTQSPLATHKKYAHEVTGLTIEKDVTDTTKGVVVYDFGDDGFNYRLLDYCGALQSIFAKVDNALGATIKSVSLNYEI